MQAKKSLDSSVSLVSIEDAQRLTGLGRTMIYELMGNGALRTVKVGRRRLILSQSIADWIDLLAGEAA